jgi:hypothetical protein
LHNLEVLNLKNNRITEIPESLGTMKNLKMLFLEENPLKVPIPTAFQERIDFTHKQFYRLH